MCSDLGLWLLHSLVNANVAGSIPRIPVRHIDKSAPTLVQLGIPQFYRCGGSEHTLTKPRPPSDYYHLLTHI